MKQDNPLFLLAAIGAVGFVFWMWWGDLAQARRGRPNPRALAGAEPASARLLMVAALVGVVLVALESAGELALGLAAQQSSITALFGLYTLAAAFGEELVFRGYLVVSWRGRAWLWISVLAFSAVFAALHPFLWRWNDGLEFTWGAKGWFSTAVVFASSLCFYVLRFHPANPTRSLLPCVLAHGAKNLGVIVVKGWQGFLTGWW